MATSSRRNKRKSKRVRFQDQSELHDEYDEDDEICRCICGDNNLTAKRPWIQCTACEVWQHNECMNVSVFDDELGLRRQLEHERTSVDCREVSDHAALGRVEIGEHRPACIVGERRARRGPLSHPITDGRLDLDDLCARIHEQLGAIRTSDARAEIDDSQAVEDWSTTHSAPLQCAGIVVGSAQR